MHVLTHHAVNCCHWLQGISDTARLHFVELAAPPNKQARAGQKGSLAKSQALSKAYSSLTSVLLALNQQRRKDELDASRQVCLSYVCAVSC